MLFRSEAHCLREAQHQVHVLHRLARGALDQIVERGPDDGAACLPVARDADAVLVTYAKLPGGLLKELKRCKVIGRFGLGVDNIDLPAAAALGITVTYVPDYCLREVSDHAMALLLAMARKIPFSNTLVQSGRWETPPIVQIGRAHV